MHEFQLEIEMHTLKLPGLKNTDLDSDFLSVQQMQDMAKGAFVPYWLVHSLQPYLVRVTHSTRIDYCSTFSFKVQFKMLGLTYKAIMAWPLALARIKPTY